MSASTSRGWEEVVMGEEGGREIERLERGESEGISGKSKMEEGEGEGEVVRGGMVGVLSVKAGR